MEIARLFSLCQFKNVVSLCTPLFLTTRLFSSYAAPIQRPWTHFKRDPEEPNGDSAVYKRALIFQRPSTIKFRETLLNSVSLIGVINRPFKDCNTADGSFGVHTLLKVNSFLNAYRNFEVLLQFWDRMAEIAVEHMKLNDFIYVSGPLVSYNKMCENGKSMYCYQVNVTEVEFVAQYGLNTALNNTVKLKPKDALSVEDIVQKRRTRLHLWQIFFSSSDEWWDNRNNKMNSKCPDFKHKDTGERLWLRDNDPPWVRKQLLLHDSRFKRSAGKHVNAMSFLSPLGCEL